MEKPEKIRDYLKVRREGGSKVITIGNVIPDGWSLITLEVLKRLGTKKILIEITRID